MHDDNHLSDRSFLDGENQIIRDNMSLDTFLLLTLVRLLVWLFKALHEHTAHFIVKLERVEPHAEVAASAGSAMRRHARSGWFLLVGLALACSAVLPLGQRWEFALVAMIVLGVPHGALDGEIARPLLRPRFGRAWFPVFALPYLALFLVVMLAWRMAPVATLAGFLVASVWHFGSEHTASGDPLGVLLRGAMPIALPVLIHPAATAGVFAAMAGVAMPLMPSWL